MSKEKLEGQNTHNNVLTAKGTKVFKRRNKIKAAIVAGGLTVGIGGGIGIGYAIFHNEATYTYSITPTEYSNSANSVTWTAKEFKNGEVIEVKTGTDILTADVTSKSVTFADGKTNVFTVDWKYTNVPVISNMVLANGDVVEFDASNTPIENFCMTHYVVDEDGVMYITVNENDYAIDYVKSLTFGDDYSSVTNIDEMGFLMAFGSLQSVNFSGLTSVKSIGDYFLMYAGCFEDSRLVSIDFNGLINLEQVGVSWLSYCGWLTDIDFSALVNLKSVGMYWLAGCPSLEQVSFNGLSNLETVVTDQDGSLSSGWLSGCQKLLTVDFSALTSLKTVGGSWLADCNELESVIVGDIAWGNGFSDVGFAGFTIEPTPDRSPGTIHGSKAEDWKKGGLDNWETSDN